MLIYIGIPRCASTSITKSIINQRGVIIIRPNDGVKADKGIIGTAKRAINKIRPEIWNSSAKFTVVRNPYDRYVSAWSMFKRHALKRLRFDVSFEEFVKNEEIQNHPSIKLHVMPQYDHIVDHNGKQCIYEIGRFENLNEDLNNILKKHGFREVDLRHYYKSKHDKYTEYYNDELMAIVRDKCIKDFEMFRY